MQLLEVNQLSKTYGSGDTAVHALKSPGFTLQKGEFAAIVWESGSGKSTLLNLIGGLDTQTSGSVIFEEALITGFTAKKDRITSPRPAETALARGDRSLNQTKQPCRM